MTDPRDESTQFARDASPEEISEAMYQRDHAARSLGIAIESVGFGTATLSMTVRQDMIQGHGTCHGGLIFSLADTAFAYACNSRNTIIVAGGCNIEFLRPALIDDTLTAVATETATVGRNGIYDVLIHDQNGETVAVFRGKSVALKGNIVTT